MESNYWKISTGKFFLENSEDMTKYPIYRIRRFSTVHSGLNDYRNASNTWYITVLEENLKAKWHIEREREIEKLCCGNAYLCCGNV